MHTQELILKGYTQDPMMDIVFMLYVRPHIGGVFSLIDRKMPKPHPVILFHQNRSAPWSRRVLEIVKSSLGRRDFVRGDWQYLEVLAWEKWACCRRKMWRRSFLRRGCDPVIKVCRTQIRWNKSGKIKLIGINCIL